MKDQPLLDRLEGLIATSAQRDLVVGWSVRGDLALSARRLSTSLSSYVVDLLAAEAGVAQYDWLHYVGLDL